jgi:hypothetical protein
LKPINNKKIAAKMIRKEPTAKQIILSILLIKINELPKLRQVPLNKSILIVLIP